MHSNRNLSANLSQFQLGIMWVVSLYRFEGAFQAMAVKSVSCLTFMKFQPGNPRIEAVKSLPPRQAPRISTWNHAGDGDVAIGRCFPGGVSEWQRPSADRTASIVKRSLSEEGAIQHLSAATATEV